MSARGGGGKPRISLAVCGLAALTFAGAFGTSPVLAQQSAIGAGIGAKALTAFGWTRDGRRDVVIRLAFAEKTPWTSGDDRILDAAVLLGRRREPSEWGWVRGALGPAWVIHSPGGQSEGGSTLGLAGQLDVVVNLGSVSRSRSWALGVTALTNVNSRASFVAVGAALHMVKSVRAPAP